MAMFHYVIREFKRTLCGLDVHDDAEAVWLFVPPSEERSGVQWPDCKQCRELGEGKNYWSCFRHNRKSVEKLIKEEQDEGTSRPADQDLQRGSSR
jgi:hypothetical protein